MTPQSAQSYAGLPEDVADGYIVIGQLGRAFGVRGEVFVNLHTDSPERFLDLGTVYLGPEATPITLLSARPHKEGVVVRLEGYEDRTAVEALRGQALQIPRSDLPDLPEGENYVFDLLGLRVVAVDGEELGEISEILFTGANEVFLVNGPRGELLIPYISDVIASEDLEAGMITVHRFPGLLD